MKKSPRKSPTPRTLPRREDGMETRARLMRAAGMIFAQEGYQATSLRAICQSANANLGAVRYYFGGKEALYRETLFSTYRDLTERGSIADMDVSGPPDEALRLFTRSFIVSLMQRRRDYPYLPAMMMRELALPTNVFDELVREVFLPIRLKLSGIVRRLLEKKAPTAQIEETSNRIVLLVIQFALCRPLLERFPGKIPEKPAEIEAMAERVFTFIMHGINSRP